MIRKKFCAETDHWKLQLLQGERPWKSLDEMRRCVLCENTFTGREVRVYWDRSGEPRLHCPTPRCPATPAQWVHPGNPLVSEEAWRDWMRLLNALCENPGSPAFGIRKRQMAGKKNSRTIKLRKIADCSAA